MATKEALGDLLTTAAGWIVKGISAITEPFAAIEATWANAFSGTFNLAPIEAYIDKLMGVDDEEKKIAATNLAAAQAKKAQDDADMKTELGKVAQKVNVVMLSYVEKNGYTILLNVGSQQSQVMWTATNPNADITEAIVAAYNASSGVAAQPPAAPAAGRTRPATTPRTTPKPPAK